MKIRNLILGEELAPELRCGYEAGKNTDPNWIWIAEHEGVPVAIMILAPVHVVVLIVRLATVPNAPNEAVWSLFANVFREIDARGYVGYFTILDPTRDTEARLLHITKGVGGLEMPNKYTLAFGDLKFTRKEVLV